MYKILVLLCLLGCNSVLKAQNNLWKNTKVDNNLTVLFPGDFAVFDTAVIQKGKTLPFKVLKATIEEDVLVITVTHEETGINADNSEAFQEAMKGVTEGMSESFTNNGLRGSFKDTIVNDVPCAKAIAYQVETGNPYLICHVFLFNDRIYSFIYTLSSGTLSNSSLFKMQKLLNGISFNKASVKEQRFSSKAESLGYKVGYLIAPVFIILIVVGLVFLVKYLARKK